MSIGVNIEHDEDEGYYRVSSPYNEDFIEWAKSEGATWDRDNKTWNFVACNWTEEDLERELKLFYPRAFR